MKQLLIKLLLILPLLLPAACDSDRPEDTAPAPAGANGDIIFNPTFAPQARVTTGADFKSEWEDGDAIGIFAVASGQSLAANAADNYIHNAKLTYSGGAWTQATPLYWPTIADNIPALNFYAYYPYEATATDPTAIAFNVLTDQSAAGNYNLSDLLTAKADNSGGGYAKGETVGLTFSHALAMVQVSVPSVGKGFGPSENLTVSLRGVQATSALDLTGGTTTSTGDKTSITMYRLEQPGDNNYETSYTYRALVPAQDIETGNSLFRFEHEKRQIFTDVALVAKLELKPGQAEKFERTLPATVLHTELIPKGIFWMGSPATEPGHQSNETQHEVTLTKDFYMGKYPVTFAQYDAFCDATSRLQPDDYFDWGRDDRPVINVSWDDAVAYCTWLSEQTGQKWTLPTEAQWEYACRGGQSESLPFGIDDGTKLTGDMANIFGQHIYELPDGYQDLGSGNGTYLAKTSVVGSYPYPNGYGLYDMHGNVFEWCSDWHNDNYGSSNASDPKTDPTGPATGYDRVMRGGDWNDSARLCRSAYRYPSGPGDASYITGFRVVFVP